jgi:hypothetical protein
LPCPFKEGDENLAGAKWILVLSLLWVAFLVARARGPMYDAVHMKTTGFALMAGKNLEVSRTWLLNKIRKANGSRGLVSKFRLDFSGWMRIFGTAIDFSVIFIIRHASSA